jgi:hypothetical protein
MATMPVATPLRNRIPKRCLSGLGGNRYLNKRNSTDQLGPIPVSVEAPRKRRFVRSSIENDCNGTVIRLLGNDLEPARIGNVSKEGNKKKDKSCVLLQYQDLLYFNVDNFCCRHCLKPLMKNRFEKIQVTFATSVNYFCDCKRVAKLEARTKENKRPGGRHKH